MNEFPKVSLISVLTAIKDGTHGTHARVRSGVPFLSAKNITEYGSVHWDNTDDLISESEYEAIHSVFKLFPGDILLTIVGTIGRCAIFHGEKVTFQRSVAYLRPKTNKIETKFLYHQISSPFFTKKLKEKANVTAQPGLYLGELSDVDVYLPDNKDEQKAIATVLDTMDEAIQSTQAMLDKQDKIKQGLLHDLLTLGVDEYDNLRPSPEIAPDLYQQTEIGLIPKGWQLTTLGDKEYFDIQTGGTPSTSVPAYWQGGTIPWMSSGEIHEKILTETRQKITQLGFDSSNAKYYPLQTILIALAGQGKTRGTIAISEIELTSNQSIAGIIVNKKKIDPYFLYYLLDSQYEQLRSASAGAGRAGLSKTILSSYQIPLPKKEEQSKISDRLTALRIFNDENKNTLSKLKKLKSGLMQDLLTGRKRMTPALIRDVEKLAEAA